MAINMPTKEQLEAQIKVAFLEADRVLMNGNWTKLATFFDENADGVFTAAPYNWTQDQVNRVKAALNLMEGVQAEYTEANGARFQMKQDWGTGL